MAGDAKVVGLGEATHGSHEFLAMKERVFRHLAEERGFTTFAFATVGLADSASVTAAERLRDQAMADNVLWWQRHTGHKMLLSAHNDHIGSLSPVRTPTRAALRRGTA